MFRYLCLPSSHALSNRMPSRKLRLHSPMLFWEISSQSYTFWKNKLCSAWARLIPTRISSWNTWLLSVTKFPPTQRHRTDVCVIGQLNNIWWCDYGWERLLFGQASLGVQMWFRMLWCGQARFTASTFSLARKLSTVWLSFIHYIPCGFFVNP